MSQGNARLSVLSFGLAVGLTWGFGMFLLGLMAWQGDWGIKMVELISDIYKGFAPTLQGSLWGALWGFVDGLIGGVFIAFFYNFFLCCCSKACPMSSCGE